MNEYLVNTAAIYKFINDQTLTMLNQGLVSSEISEQIALPEALDRVWYTRQYYGTVAHDARAVYQRFMGWYDANPVHPNDLTPQKYATKLVFYLGDLAVVLEKAKVNSEAGEYQWVAQITNTLVFADPANVEARLLCADALEQLGYQAESGTWRNCYLTAAMELRFGNQALVKTNISGNNDSRNHMSAEMILDYLGICLDKSALADRDFKVNYTCVDTGQQFTLRFKNGPLLHFEGMQASDALLTLEGPRLGLLALASGNAEVVKSIVSVSGDEELFEELCGSFNAQTGAGLFNIVEP